MTARRRLFHPVRILFSLVGVALITLGLINPVAVLPAQAVGTVHAPVAGAGSTWSSNAIDQWVRNVWDNYKWRVTFDKQGSSKGRSLFANGTVDFAVSEIPYNLTGSDAVDPVPPRPLAYMPIVAGGTSFMYNLVIGGKRVTNLRLSGEVITKIFTNQITEWNHPEIQADNPGLAMPAVPIIPVVRSDGSGTSAQFTAWMRSEYGGHWQAYCDAVGKSNCGITSNYPMPSGSRFQGKNGSEGVSGFVSQAHSMGAITYVEYSYALNARFPVAKVLNSAGYYAEPTAQNVAVGLLGAGINNDESSPDYLTQQLEGVYRNGDPRAYPLSSYSYMILPTDLSSGFTENKGLTLADFSAYFLCEGQQQAERLGYSPLPINLVQAGQAQIQKIPGGNPVIKGITDCNNPTFSPDGSNRLANEAPMPPECDRQGQTQCTRGTGGATDDTDPSGGGGGGDANGGNGGTGTDGTAGGVGTAGADGSMSADGQSLGGSTSIAAAQLTGTPVDIPAGLIGVNPAMVLGGSGMLLGTMLPPIFDRLRRPASGLATGVAPAGRGRDA